ncbi:MAG: hypothetical protein HFACDABA_01025 [Anaerolineales bacterium]|nr:hypothetical protein [Anaerolineales bacterium]
MNTKPLFVTLLVALSLIVSGCGPSAEQIATMTASAWIPTWTPSPTSTSAPAATNTPAATDTPVPTSTPTSIPCPTPYPDSLFSDAFELDCGAWSLSKLSAIQDGVLQLTNGGHEFGGIVIPVGSPLTDSIVQFDFVPSPKNNSSEFYFYGAGCRMNATGTDFYFFGLSPVGDGTFLATFIQFADSKIVDSVMIPNFFGLPVSQSGEGVTATLACLDHTIGILSDGKYVAKVTDSDLAAGDVFLGIFQTEGLEGSVSFDNVVVTIQP